MSLISSKNVLGCEKLLHKYQVFEQNLCVEGTRRFKINVNGLYYI